MSNYLCDTCKKGTTMTKTTLSGFVYHYYICEVEGDRKHMPPTKEDGCEHYE